MYEYFHHPKYWPFFWAKLPERVISGIASGTVVYFLLSMFT